jgi:adenylosuccinate lyase
VERLEEQMRLLFNIPSLQVFAELEITTHHMAYPQIDWRKFGGKFVEENLRFPSPFPTTQIEHYDHFAAFLML